MTSQPFSPQFVATVEANRTIKDELTEALRVSRQRRRISVTDLLNPRLAFFRRKRPDIQPSPERLQLMFTGTGFHDLFGRSTSSEEFIEQFVEFEGVVGKIDVFEDLPTELKTTGSIPENVLTARPSYLDQLGMYCAMAGRQQGRLVLYRRTRFGSEPMLIVYRVDYLNPDAIVAEILRRRDQLEHALATNNPSGLAKCEWFGIGCDYREHCGCEGAIAGSRLVPVDAMRIAEDCQGATTLLARLDNGPKHANGFTLNDLVFPRKAALSSGSGEGDEPRQDGLAALAQLERNGLKSALDEALRFGRPGAFTRTPVSLRSLRGWVRLYCGVPTLLRSTRFTRMVEREKLASTLTHYFDRLAFESALVGSQRSRLVIYYEAIPGDKFMVYDIGWRDLPAIRAEAERRLLLLESGAPAQELPPCPQWMAKFCQFAPGCGCGGQTV